MEQDNARGSQPAELTEVFADLDEQRHWNLISAINTQLAGPGEFPGYEPFAARAAELVRAAVGDAVGVLLTDLPGCAEPAFGYAHVDPARQSQARALLDSMGIENLHLWVRDLARTARQGRSRLEADDIDAAYARLLEGQVNQLRLADIIYAPLRNPDGTACGLMCAARDPDMPPYTGVDIAALTAAADAISMALGLCLARAEERASTRYWETAFESGAVGKIVLDADRRYVRVNGAAQEILGRDLATLLDLRWPTFSDPRDFDEDMSDLHVASAGGRAAVRVRRFEHPDGRDRWVQRSVAGVLDDAGQVQHYHLEFTEITELYEAQAEVSALVRLVESSPDFLGISALDGTAEYINPAGRELIGLAPDDDVASIKTADLYGSQGRPFSAEALSQDAHGFWEGEATLLDRRDGRDIPTHVRAFLITDPKPGEAVKIGTIQRDMRQSLAVKARERDAALAAAELAERRRIANEVHDDALQLLAAAQLRMQLVINDIAAGDGPAQSADTVAELISQAQGRLRSLVASAEQAVQAPVRQSE